MRRLYIAYKTPINNEIGNYMQSPTSHPHPRVALGMLYSMHTVPYIYIFQCPRRDWLSPEEIAANSLSRRRSRGDNFAPSQTSMRRPRRSRQHGGAPTSETSSKHRHMHNERGMYSNGIAETAVDIIVVSISACLLLCVCVCVPLRPKCTHM